MSIISTVVPKIRFSSWEKSNNSNVCQRGPLLSIRWLTCCTSSSLWTRCVENESWASCQFSASARGGLNPPSPIGKGTHTTLSFLQFRIGEGGIFFIWQCCSIPLRYAVGAKNLHDAQLWFVLKAPKINYYLLTPIL